MKYRIIEVPYKGTVLYQLEKRVEHSSKTWSWKVFKFIDSIFVEWEYVNISYKVDILKELINELENPCPIKVVYQV